MSIEIGRREIVARISRELQSLQRQRTIVLKSRNMQANRLQSVVAGTLGYKPELEEKERKKAFKEAAQLINLVGKGDEVDHILLPIIRVTLVGISGFNDLKRDLERKMIKEVKKLPVHPWTKHPNQRGFGSLFLAVVVGETGDLYNYKNYEEGDPRYARRGGVDRCGGVYRLYRRLGCAPWTFNPTGEVGGEKTLMGATWRSGREGKLPSEEWEKFGYSPRRRSISYLIGEGLVKQNFFVTKKLVKEQLEAEETAPDMLVDEFVPSEPDAEGDEEKTEKKPLGTPGPYRALYDHEKVDFLKKYPEAPKLRCHRHGMLMATKLLLRNLWLAWNEK